MGLTKVIDRGSSYLRHTKQRMSRGGIKRDTSSLDHHLAVYIEQVLGTYLQENTYRLEPTIILNRPSGNINLTDGEWKDVIDEIRRGFKNYATFVEQEYTLSEKYREDARQEVRNQLKRSFDLLSEVFEDLWR
jgi:hypothetical protein